MQEIEHLDQKLRNAAYDQLAQFGHPQMPKNFHSKVTQRVAQLLREIRMRFISLNDGFREIREFTTDEYQRIYPFED